jgi:hypothetical protein
LRSTGPLATDDVVGKGDAPSPAILSAFGFFDWRARRSPVRGTRGPLGDEASFVVADISMARASPASAPASGT